VRLASGLFKEFSEKMWARETMATFSRDNQNQKRREKKKARGKYVKRLVQILKRGLEEKKREIREKGGRNGNANGKGGSTASFGRSLKRSTGKR